MQYITKKAMLFVFDHTTLLVYYDCTVRNTQACSVHMYYLKKYQI